MSENFSAPKEIQRRVFELTLALYRVTDFFPQNEALRKQLREKANEIFSAISEYGHSNGHEHEAVSVVSKTQSIKGFLGLARTMRFVKPINLAVLEREYDLLAHFFTRELERFSEEEKRSKETAGVESRQQVGTQPEVRPHTVQATGPQWYEFRFDPPPTEEESQIPKVSAEPVHISRDITARQRAILDHLRSTGQAKVSDFFSIFSDLSSKTIQRDLQELVSQNKLRKAGEKRWTTYSIISESL